MKAYARILAVGLSVALAGLLSACGAGPTDQPAASGEPTAPAQITQPADSTPKPAVLVSVKPAATGESQPSDEPEPTAEAAQTKRIGQEGFGYVDVPQNWRRFFDRQGGDDYQYSDPEGNGIITMNIFDLSGLSEEEAAQIGAEEAAQSVWQNIEDAGGKDIQGAQVKLRGYDAYQVYAVYDDGDYFLPG